MLIGHSLENLLCMWEYMQTYLEQSFLYNFEMILTRLLGVGINYTRAGFGSLVHLLERMKKEQT